MKPTQENTPLACTPEPPYFAVIFASRRTPGDAGYGAMADCMVELSSGMPGFLGMDSARGEDGVGITVCYWRSEADIAAWRTHADHMEAKRLGHAQWYADFELRIAKVERAYGMSKGLSMRIAIVSDIHGNLPALDAVLADIAALGVDATVNLGDIASGPLWPLETLRRLMPLGLPTIAGNHERQVLALAEAAEGDRSSDALAAHAIGDSERAWLRGLPKTLRLTPEVEACHGTPASDCTYLLETVTEDFGRRGSRGIRAATAGEVQARLAAASKPAVLLCGHSHVPRLLRLDDGRLVVNPGSVGLPAYDDDRPWPHWVENEGPEARWAWIERRADGWHAELCRSRYDSEAAARRAESLGRGDWADALRTGRVGRTEAEVLGAAS